MKKKSETKEITNAYQKAAPYLNVVYSFFGGIIFFGYLGYWLDEKLQQRSLFLIAGVFLGFALGLYRMVKVINELERKKK